MLPLVRAALSSRSPASRALQLARCSSTFPRGGGNAPSASPPLSERFSMKGKVCLVTGAAQGLGYDFGRAFVETGCTSLALLDLRGEQAKHAAEEIKNAYKKSSEDALQVIGVECNVASEASVQKAYEDVMAHFGRVDAVVASAGIVENFPALDYPDARARLLFDVNYHGAFYTAREAARHMIPAGGGSIVLISSMSADPQAPYNASKAAVKNLAASLAVEWAKKNVRVNCLSPGYTQTHLTRQMLEQDEELNRFWKSMTPMGRLGEPEDVSGAVIFLSSDAARFITGTELLVDGGYCLT
ncbi:NAD(P)-binding protein [Phellopilus nigrolimitatus]|nr:NAD(P)-binding protein [Phellopilus nigrolimitatus]